MIYPLTVPYDAGWRIRTRCAYGRADTTHRKSSRECTYRVKLDMETLVWTRGRDFPLSRLESLPGLSSPLHKNKMGTRRQGRQATKASGGTRATECKEGSGCLDRLKMLGDS